MIRIKYIFPVILAIALLVSGCGDTLSSSLSESESSTIHSSTVTTALISSTSTIAVDTKFTDRDLDPSYDDSSATHITLNGTSSQVSGSGAKASNGSVIIYAQGTYVITGSLTDGQILVTATDAEKVHIVLNGVNIHDNDSAPIYIKNADKVFITLAENTENTLTDGTTYVQTDDNNVDAVIFSKADLTINGSGTLNITSKTAHGIVSKDDLVIAGGIYNIVSADNAVNGKDAIKIKDGTFTISSSRGKGLTSKNDEDATRGYVYIAGGTLNITKCTEGIEGTAIIIEGGDINIVASDDGINAANGITSGGGQMGGGMETADKNVYLSVSGGTININAAGDGIDSNGDVYISGGTIYVSGPTANNNGGLDYNGTANITGGTVIVVGSTGMAQAFSSTSTQASLLYNFSSSLAAGTQISLLDAQGSVLASYTAQKNYQSVVVSAPGMSVGSTYTLTAGSQSVEIKLSSVVTSNGTSGGMNGAGKGGNGFQPRQ